MKQAQIDYSALKKWFFKRHFCMFTTSYEYHLEKCIKTFERFAKELYHPSWQPVIIEPHFIPKLESRIRCGISLPTKEGVAMNFYITESAYEKLRKTYKEELDKSAIEEYNAREEEYFAMKQYEEEFEL